MTSRADFKYRAFISYSHSDQAWAAAFHKAAEQFRIPRELVGKDARYGPVPKSLFPIFRDRDELPTSSNLNDAIKMALKDSLYLVVVCSPDAAKSLWVSQEILEFKRLGRSERILPVIVAGEPNASDRGTPELEAFPEALRFDLDADGGLSDVRVEPVAADARPEADGPVDARLKLIAGLLGVNFNDLKRRELVAARRRARIAQGIAGGMAALAIAAGFFAFRSEMQRREIAQQNTALLLRESRLLARDAEVQAAAGEGAGAAATALRALPLNMEAPERPVAPEAIGALTNAVRSPMRGIELQGPARSNMKRVHISPDDRSALIVGDQRVAELWNLEGPLKPVTVSQSTADATSALFREEDGRRRVLMWGTIGPGSVSLYEEKGPEMELLYTDGPKALAGRSVLSEGDELAFLVSKTGELASLDKIELKFSSIADTDPNMGLEKYFGLVVRRHPDVDASRIVATHPDRQLVLLHEADDTLVVAALDKNSRQKANAPSLKGPLKAGFSADGESIVVFAPDLTPAIYERPNRAFLLRTDGKKPPIPLDMRGDYRCGQVGGEPRFRDLDGAIVASDKDQSGVCVWDGASGRLLDRVPIPKLAPSHRLKISPRGRWALSFKAEVPAGLWSTERLLRFDTSATAQTFEAVRYCEGEFGTHPCPIVPAAGVKIGEGDVGRPGEIVYQGAQRETRWGALYPSSFTHAGPLLSPSGRYLAVIALPAKRSGDPQKDSGSAVGLLDLETRKVVCRSELTSEELRDLRDAFVFDTGPSVFLEKARGLGAPFMAQVPCVSGASGPLHWWFRHERNGDTGVASLFRDARLSRDGSRLLTLANDETWRLWDVASGLELTRGRTTGLVSRFDETPDGRLAMVALESDEGDAWERLALPPETGDFVASVRRRLPATMRGNGERAAAKGEEGR